MRLLACLEIEPRSFSFNTPHGACPDCTGLGTRRELDPVLIVPDVGKSIDAGAVEPWAKASKNDSYFKHLLEGVGEHYGFDTHQPWGRLSADQQRAVLYGSNGEMVTVRYVNQHGQVRTHDTVYEGVIPNLERRYSETSSDAIRASIEAYMTERECPTCHGRRLRPESLAVTVDGLSIDKVTDLPVGEAIHFVQRLNDTFGEREMLIARQILKELLSRLRFLMDVGLHYLTLSRGAASLSGGEAQRIRLATQIGSQLMGVLYILDEPASACTSGTTRSSSRP
jgi:excinuclease ABC subunit A